MVFKMARNPIHFHFCKYVFLEKHVVRQKNAFYVWMLSSVNHYQKHVFCGCSSNLSIDRNYCRLRNQITTDTTNVSVLHTEMKFYM